MLRRGRMGSYPEMRGNSKIVERFTSIDPEIGIR
jgi:hypothetical protein